jgi:inner membrane protein involved in colicin E2 resistance
VDLVNVHAAFVAATITSVGLVTSYLRAALGQRFPWRLAAAGQCVYLVLFSYSFFLKGMTGLTVTIGSILTLAALMYATARLDWPSVFGRRQPA